MNKLLAFRQVLGKHAGENQAQIVLEVLEELQIQDRIGCLVGDNAASNDTAVSAILTTLHPEYTKEQRSAFRVRCLGHIVNLCAHALIFGKGKGRRREELARAERKGDEDGWESVWRRIGVVGRLHNIIRYIRWSPQRREEFAHCIQGGNLAEFDQLELIQDNDTRCNSFHLAISRALELKSVWRCSAGSISRIRNPELSKMICLRIHTGIILAGFTTASTSSTLQPLKLKGMVPSFTIGSRNYHGC